MISRDITRSSHGRGYKLETLTLQYLMISAVAILFPLAIIRLLYGAGTFADDQILTSVPGTLTAIFFGLTFLRKVTTFPGTSIFGFIIPAFASSFSLVIIFYFVLRLEYSSIFFLGGFMCAVAVSFTINLVLNRIDRPRFYVVPAGRTDIVVEIPGVDWLMMEAPVVPVDVRSAIVADLRFDHADEWERMLAEAAISGIAVYHTKQLRESLTGRVTIEHLSENSFGSLVPNLAYRKIKRALDVIASVLLFPVLAIPLMVVAIAIRIDSPGPVFFIQRRMGHRGRHFSMVKFRTMTPRPVSTCNLEARKDAITQNEDVRVTRLGRFLRRSRIDELPQIWNILRGEMSWIGPRPEAVPLSTWYEAELPFYRYRHIVRPGITGWAQVNQGHVAELDAVGQKLNFDFYYIKNFSAWLDLLIVVRTLQTVFSGFGSK